MFPALNQVDNAYGMPIPDGLKPMPGVNDVRPDEPGAAKDTSGPSVAVGSTPDEDVRKKAHGTFQEFLSIRDFTEAETCMRELALSVPQEGMVVATALNDSYDVQLETERDNLRAVVVHLADAGLLTGEGIQAGFQVCILWVCHSSVQLIRLVCTMLWPARTVCWHECLAGQSSQVEELSTLQLSIALLSLPNC